jgi:leucyl-tRNA synthetase
MIREQAQSLPFSDYEPFWQNRWEESKIFQTDPLPDQPNWVVIELPPFANGSLHLGHVRNYVMADVSARFRRMAGYNVLYTSGFDSYGLPNELAAMEKGRHPQDLAEEVMAEMRRDFLRLGLSHDTRRIIGYHEPQYYRWVQWVFLKLYELGLAYKQEGQVNWCKSCSLTLADSLVEQGRCWRCGSDVETRTMEQWLINESAFADEMLEGLPKLKNWSDKIKKIHVGWIGRREGATVRFNLKEAAEVEFSVFINHPALLAGAGFIALAPMHSLVTLLGEKNLLPAEILKKLQHFRESGFAVRPFSAGSSQAFEFPPVQLGVSAINPLTGEEVPLIVSFAHDLRTNNGITVGFPAHIRADNALTQELGIESRQVLKPAAGKSKTESSFDWNESWIMLAPAELEGISAEAGKAEIIKILAEKGSGEASVNYRLRDWNIARQRYWGPPIPIIFCPACGVLPVPEESLPIVLPYDVDFTGDGNPLEKSPAFVHTTCFKCGGAARRETDTLEAYSSPWWYHWNCKGMTTENPFDKQEASWWQPVDLMIGGEDQARTCFFHIRMMARALKRAGVVEYDEPVDTLLAIGMVKTDGKKMSKSAGNTVEPFALVGKYGTDSLRLSMMAGASPESDLNWSDVNLKQTYAFLNKVWNFGKLLSAQQPEQPSISFEKMSGDERIDESYSLSRKLARQMQTAVERTTDAYCRNNFHLAASNLSFLFSRIETYFEEAISRRGSLDERDLKTLAVAFNGFLRMLAPLCPHLAEQLWSECRGQNFIAQACWVKNVLPGEKINQT